ncbi:hypothetical protein ACOSQ2_009885 [Xanthoceras sorbifolium]
MAWVEQIERFGIDNRPLLIPAIQKTSGPNNGLGCRFSCFHFEEAWAKEEDCKSLIKGAWNSYCFKGAVCGVKASSLAMAEALSTWNKKKRKIGILILKR